MTQRNLIIAGVVLLLAAIAVNTYVAVNSFGEIRDRQARNLQRQIAKDRENAYQTCLARRSAIRVGNDKSVLVNLLITSVVHANRKAEQPGQTLGYTAPPEISRLERLPKAKPVPLPVC